MSAGRLFHRAAMAMAAATLFTRGGRSAASVDIEFDIGPAYYNFVDVRYIGAPVLREHIYAPVQNIIYIERTVNVTNITYNNAMVYNHGPDYNRLSAYSTRPIQRLTLQRDIAPGGTTAAQSSTLTRVQGDRLIVAAPPTLQRPSQSVAPRVVKTKVEQPNVETGWVGVTDPTAKAKIQEKIKKEDPKSVPPPQIQPRNPAALNAAAPAAGPAARQRRSAVTSPLRVATPKKWIKRARAMKSRAAGRRSDNRRSSTGARQRRARTLARRRFLGMRGVATASAVVSQSSPSRRPMGLYNR